MDVDLWVTALRIIVAVLVVGVVWPSLLDVRRWLRRLDIKTETKRAAQ